LGGAFGSALGPRGGMLVMTILVPVSGLIMVFSPVRRVRDLPTTQLGAA
jgi:hypothetical protein